MFTKSLRSLWITGVTVLLLLSSSNSLSSLFGLIDEAAKAGNAVSRSIKNSLKEEDAKNLNKIHFPDDAAIAARAISLKPIESLLPAMNARVRDAVKVPEELELIRREQDGQLKLIKKNSQGELCNQSNSSCLNNDIYSKEENRHTDAIKSFISKSWIESELAIRDRLSRKDDTYVLHYKFINKIKKKYENPDQEIFLSNKEDVKLKAKEIAGEIKNNFYDIKEIRFSQLAEGEFLEVQLKSKSLQEGHSNSHQLSGRMNLDRILHRLELDD